MRVVGRAVQRIDDPTVFAVAFEGRGDTGFFRQDRVAGIIRFDPVDDQRLGG